MSLFDITTKYGSQIIQLYKRMRPFGDLRISMMELIYRFTRKLPFGDLTSTVYKSYIVKTFQGPRISSTNKTTFSGPYMVKTRKTYWGPIYTSYFTRLQPFGDS